MKIPDFEVSAFHGLNTKISDTKTLKPGVATSQTNWLTGKFGDHIELRRGLALLGQTRHEGAGKVTGLGVGAVGNRQVPFFSHGEKVKYYNDSDDDTHEIDTADLLGSAADGVDVWFAPYHGLAGSFMYLGSQESSIFKIPVANPGSAVDQVATSYRFKVLKIGQGRSFAGQRKGTDGKRDDTSLYLSYIDKSTFGQFTAVTGESVGSLGSTTYTGTLGSIAAKRTVFLVVIKEAGGETVSDNGDGTLTGDQGSTGTINYATGAYSVTFNHVTTGAVTVDYFWEDATSHGVLDFTFSGTRVAGEGNQFLQADGGSKLMAIMPFINIEYCLHLLRTWQYTAALDDTDSTNLPYRNVGIPYERAAYPTPEGILMVDTSNPSDPKIRRLELSKFGDTSIVPTSISDALDLSGHAFDYAIAFRWGDYEIICCQEFTQAAANAYNSVMYVRSVVSGAWDRLEYFVSCLAELQGALIAGDFLSNNVFTLFSGFDDDGSPIANHWQDGPQNLGTDRLKVVHRGVIRGLIQKTQKVKVSLALDDGPYVEVGGRDEVVTTEYPVDDDELAQNGELAYNVDHWSDYQEEQHATNFRDPPYFNWYWKSGKLFHRPSGPVRYETFGSAGSRIFVVEYLNVGLDGFAASYLGVSFQIKLFEADNHIEIHTLSSPSVSGVPDPSIGSAGVGYEVNDLLLISGGNNDAVVQVTSVNGSGGITSLTPSTQGLNSRGTGYSNGSYPLSGGHGTGATVTVTVSSGLATQGIQNEDGTIAFTPAGRNGATFTLANDGVSFTRVNATTYTVAATTFSWVTLTSAATEIAFEGPTSVSDAISLPFSFLAFGTSYSSLYVGSSGLVGFGSTHMIFSGGTALPDASFTAPIICGYWSSLDPSIYSSDNRLSATLEPGKRYQVTFDVTVDSGELNVNTGTSQRVGTVTTSGPKEMSFVAESYSASMRFAPSSDFKGSIDNVSVREWPLPTDATVHHPLIEGDGAYVDQGINTAIGSYTIGSKVIGGGGEATAHPFEIDFPIHTDRFQFISIKFEALDVGYVEIDSYKYKDIRDKGRRSPAIKTV